MTNTQQKMNTAAIIGKSLSLILATCLLVSTEVYAEEMRYKPINPQNGGSPLNGSYLLGKAQATKGFTAPRTKLTQTEEFQKSIQQAILSKVSREVADSILGEDAKDSGHIELGGLEIDFKKVSGEIHIQVMEEGKHGVTEIKIPEPVF